MATLSKSKAEARVQLAKDVLESIKTKKLRIAPGTYLYSEDKKYLAQFRKLERLREALDDEYTTAKAAKLEEQLKALRDQEFVPPKKCEVCAIGALFVQAVDRHDKLKLGALTFHTDFSNEQECVDPNSKDLIKYLGQWFSEKELRLMETIFEGSYHGSWDLCAREDIDTAEYVSSAIRDTLPDRVNVDEELQATAVLQYVMEHIIDNKGALNLKKALKSLRKELDAHE